MPRTLMYVQPELLRKVGRPRTTWTDEVEEDAKMLGIRIWSATIMNGEAWRELLMKVTTLYMSCRADDDDDDDDLNTMNNFQLVTAVFRATQANLVSSKRYSDRREKNTERYALPSPP